MTNNLNVPTKSKGANDIQKTSSSHSTNANTSKTSKSNISTPQMQKQTSKSGTNNSSNQHIGMLNQQLNMDSDDFGMKITSEEELQELSQKHERLIEVILAEEEEVITLHRQHIDDMVELVKQVKDSK